ncbi:MAG: hypothetical protein JWN86_2792 [Planctomycetota bacterium]|nr:hypothetical protein [Planctomycetota bacterium]
MIASLATVLSRYPAAIRPLTPPESLGNAGGLSGARLWRFRSQLGPTVARAWPPGVTRTHLAQIHGWLKRADRLDFVAAPFAAIDGATFQAENGIFWEVCRWMPGEADLKLPPPIAKVRAAMSGLAAFHQVMGPSEVKLFCPGLADRSREIRKLLGGDSTSWRQVVLAHPPDPRRELALRWLDLASVVAPGIDAEISRFAGSKTRVQTVIRDARPQHFLFTGDVLTGLVDFGAMGIDTVAADLARLIADWIEPDRVLRGEALAAYARVRPLDSAEMMLIEAFERSSSLLGGGRWLKWHFVDRIVFEDPNASLRGLQRGVERIEGLI